MSEAKKPVWPLILMLLWYALFLAGSGFALILGLSFGSEAYRGAGMPAAEVLPFAIPFVLVIIATLSTVLLWHSDKRNLAYALCATSLFPFILGFAMFL